jgi:hypothetical protein
VDQHRFDADPVPDQTFHFDTDPDPDLTSSYTQVRKSVFPVRKHNFVSGYGMKASTVF